ncbi:hypothetical protein [Gymnodinialimonas ceratoperidinii]|uniref:Uncharacterized protein n=1 Tax=Gymnodinialimonas ceratoperidinii TaxID=2856823 RepID=A0A8F6Y8Q1_9RHOB|nr:hypothetical protein [Gymnodinialimonas ceratoperidinii]QXT38139.1 hypothetical protein KYE46_09230 [Gymnodinialimonas ceratoperidinii]
MTRTDFDQASGATKNFLRNRGHDGVRMIHRNTNLIEPVQLPFLVTVGSNHYKGHALTLDEFEVYTKPISQRQSANDPLASGATVEVSLHVDLYGVVAVFVGTAEVNEEQKDVSDNLTRFTFRKMNGRSREALRRLVRSYHAGHVPTTSDLIEDHDPETQTAVTSSPATPVPPARRLKNIAGIALSAVVILGAIGFVGASAFERFFLIKAQFATVTAPAVEMMSAEMGQIRTPIETLGQSVSRDDLLYTVHSASLVADADELRARVEFLTQMLQDAESASAESASVAIGEPQSDGLTAAEGTPQAVTHEGVPLGDANATDLLSMVGGRASVQDIRRTLSLTEGELSALEVRLSSLVGYSPCECIVTWHQEDAAWVVPGDTVAVLARTVEDALRVEALVHVLDIGSMFVGQTALVTNVATGETIHGLVERITLDPRQQPRVGFPQWLRQEPTLASVILTVGEALNSSLIGQPVEVSIRRRNLSLWDRLSQIWDVEDVADGLESG